MAKITKTWKKAGYLPGQYQKVSIEFISRNGDDVKVKWDFYAKSLGWDTYTYNVRHNTFHIYYGNTKKVTQSYQASGNCGTKSFSGNFTISGIKNKDDDLVFYYDNDRVWATHTNAWDPRSTGVVDKTKIGTLTIPQNNQHTVDFDELINDNVHTYKVYHDNKWSIPKLNPESRYFTFKGWTTEDYAKGHKSEGVHIPNSILAKAKVDVTAGKSITVSKNLDYYAVWKPKTCKYKFYDYNRKLISDLTIEHTWNTETKLPNLDKVSNGKYKQAGYTFYGWRRERTTSTGTVQKHTYAPEDTDFAKCTEWPLKTQSTLEVTFYAKNTAKDNDVIFHFPDQDLTFGYNTDEKFSLDKALSTYGKSTYEIKPGYNLIGWTNITPETSGLGVAMPNKAFSNLKVIKGTNDCVDHYADKNGKYTVYLYKGKVVFDYKDFKIRKSANPVLNLYPYYEYYTTAYVYTSSGWKLAMPYVYTSDGWKAALSHIYTNNTEWEL